MTRKTLRLLLSLVVVSLVIFSGCRKGTQDEQTHSGFHPLVAAFTSEYISTSGTFSIEFRDPPRNAVPGATAPSNVATIIPKVKGSWIWLDEYTLQFKPDGKLVSGQTYKIRVHLSKLFDNQDEDFYFSVTTFAQSYRFLMGDLEYTEEDGQESYRIKGSISVAEDITPEEAKAMLNIAAENTTIPVTWQHTDGRNHSFELFPIPIKDKAYNISISHSGAPIDTKGEGTEEVAVPSSAEFTVIKAYAEQQPVQVIRVVFSSALDPTQDLTGMYEISNNVNTRYTANSNILEIYPEKNIQGEFELKILPGIRNKKGLMTSQTDRFYLGFENLKPAVEFIGVGNIMPFSDNLIMHFRAVSLKSVIVRVIRIYESNVPHFLQVNTMDGSSELKRAGRLEYANVINLDRDPSLDLGKWNIFALDLSNMVKPSPGSLYRIELGFEQIDAIYQCDDETKQESTKRKWIDDGEFWDNPYDYYSEYPYYYEDWDWDWYERNNPCNKAYYTRSKWVAQNLLASNLGLTAKLGNDKRINVYITDLNSTAPIDGANIEVLDFQLQVLAKAVTDKDGMAVLDPTEKQPFLLIADKAGQKGYLRMDAGRSLSVSRFNVSGQNVKEGLKGYIYGDRGVWRPGDSLFISFFAEHRGNNLPANYPVIFELIDPRGRVQSKMTARHPENKIYSFRTATPEDAPTGFWRARVIMGDATFEKQVRIETIKPNRLKIELGIKEGLVSTDKNIEIPIKSEWLHGAPASGLKADVKMTTKPTSTSFDSYPGYVFDDATRSYDQAEQTLYEGRLNQQGEGSFIMPSVRDHRSPGFLKANLISRVYEEGGSFSISQTTRTLSPYRQYVGIRAPEGDKNNLLLTDQDYKIEVVTVNEAGTPVNINGLKYKIYKISWRWWWDSTEEELGRYISSSSSTLISSGTIRTENGKTSIPFRINHPEWGRYLVRVEDPLGGHAACTTVMVDWPGWAQKTGREGSEGASVLTFNTDRSEYKPGDNAVVTFPSGGEGRALVTIENGTKVLKSWWVKPEEGSTSFSFQVTPEMSPNIYVHISLLQPHKRKNNDLPIRLYGVIPVTVNDPSTKLQPQLKVADEWRPEQKAVIEVTEAGKREMDYTIAIVDEGLLDLTNFATPDPWKYFNAQEALGVRTFDMFDQVLGAYGGRIEQVFGIGGGDELNPDGSKNQLRRFEPMVKFIGPLKLKKNGKNKHEIEIPNYFGSVRIMLVACNETASGSIDKKVAVKQPLMVWSSLPRVLGPGETVSLPVTVFASGKAAGKVKVSLSTDKLLNISGEKVQYVNFEKDGEKTIYFDLKAGNETGISVVEVIAEAGSEKGSNKINLPVRNANPSVTRVQSVILGKGESKELSYEAIGTKGTNGAILEISTIGSIDFGRRLEFLLQYPHGCIEQITSAAFPQVFLPSVAELSAEEAGRSKTNVQSVLSRLRSYQTTDGGFAYWAGGSRADEWGSSYAGHFMLSAAEKGYTVPDQLRKNWISYQKKQAKTWVPSNTGKPDGQDLIQAYRLFTLALAGEADLGSMNRLRQQTNLSSQARWRLAGAYAIAGLKEVAGELTANVSADAPSSSFENSYGSPDRDFAMVIETLLYMGQKEKAVPLVRQLATRLSSDSWMSTQTTAYALLAISKYTEGSANAGSNAKIELTINKGKPENITLSKAIFRQKVDIENETNGKIKIANHSGNEIFAQLILTGLPLSDTLSKKVTDGLNLKIEYLDLDNRPVDIRNLSQGKDFKAIVTISNPSPFEVSNIALSQIFPSGWEIRNSRMEEGASVHELDQPDYRDIRDDRVYSYFNLNAGRSKRLVVLLHASYAGKFYLPAVTAEAMYDHNTRAIEPGTWVEVTK